MSSRKRPYPGWKRDDDEEEELVTLTPHTLRLLRLCQEGTLAHARLAASHLTSIAAQSSPLVLWDLLGRLVETLASPSWSCRQNASVAMEGIGKHLPPLDQEQFLQSQNKNDDGLWLELSDLEQTADGNNTTGLDLVLENGRVLLSSLGTEYDIDSMYRLENEQLDKLDQSAAECRDFLKQRIMLQRQILAQRLGLGGALQSVARDSIPAAITNEDLCPSSRESQQSERTKKKTVTSVRTLLVMEMEQQRKSGDLSHRNPQTMLATELVYRIFSPEWHVRHGALLGALSLIKAWRNSGNTFGSWPQDILARCLCVLGLDRFGDYSGKSESVVAAVRETAGQLVALLLSMAPLTVQQTTLELLLRMTDYVKEWEVRHGALLAIKYIVAFIAVQNTENILIDKASLLMDAAVKRLCDTSDDVRSVAAQVVSCFFQEEVESSPVDLEYLVSACGQPLWNAVAEIKNVSSCAVDVVQLFSKILSFNCSLLTQHIAPYNGENRIDGQIEMVDRLLEKLASFLDFDSFHVKISTLEAIAVVSEPIVGTGSHSLTHALRRLLERVFETFFLSTCGTPDDLKLMGRFERTRDTAWKKIVDVSIPLLSRNEKEFNEPLLCTTLRYAGLRLIGSQDSAHELLAVNRIDFLDDRSEDGFLFQTRLCSSSALLYLLSRASECKQHQATVLSFVEAVVRSMLSSPWSPLCEAASLLHKSAGAAVPMAGESHCPLSASIRKCQEFSSTLLVDTPPCLRAGASTLSREFLSVCDHAFVATIRVHLQDSQQCDVSESLQNLTSLYNRAVNLTKDSSNEMTVSIEWVRVKATLAGSLLPLGSRFLPPRLTPIVRALMTSLKSETSTARQQETCCSLQTLLLLLSESASDDNSARVRNKVLENICILSLSTGKREENASMKKAIQVVESFLASLPPSFSLRSIVPIWSRLQILEERQSVASPELLDESLVILEIVARSLSTTSESFTSLIDSVVPLLVRIGCSCPRKSSRLLAISALSSFCVRKTTATLDTALPIVIGLLNDNTNDNSRLGACKVLRAIIESAETRICCFVRCLIPKVMSLMTDPLEAVSRLASQSFAELVRVAPLVRAEKSRSLAGIPVEQEAEQVIDHLINGKPLPPFDLPKTIVSDLNGSKTVLRNYQVEGVAWITFLQTVKLSGALCDDMGCGKTLQALIGIAVSHHRHSSAGEGAISLIVCPSTVVHHWASEIRKFFSSGKVFKSVAYVGTEKQRKLLSFQNFSEYNIVITSYSVLRKDVRLLASQQWNYCVLDEGHLLKNPKTATSLASKRVRAKHRLILTGTPVQNRVHELWAVFDFLMPNFLGNSSSFQKNYATPITKSHSPDASPECIGEAMEKLKSLHQQVLPFILRREKQQVLKELPPKCVTNVLCSLSPEQHAMYNRFCQGQQGQESLKELKKVVDGSSSSSTVVSDVFKSLTYLRLLCTHPTLVFRRDTAPCVPSADMGSGYSMLQHSGKLLALNDLLRSAGLCAEELTAADNDASLLYLESNDSNGESSEKVIDVENNNPDEYMASDWQKDSWKGPKCLIFAQFSRSLDVVEQYLFKPLMPSLRYLRMDGTVPLERRSGMVDQFNGDESITVMLLTTRVGGLGLNLTGAATVIFLEIDWNPHVDLQAMDRCHRIGQKETVNVYRLVTSNTIEEQIMKIQDIKLALSKAIVNTDNSTMYSMGTDRLLDIFTCGRDVDRHVAKGANDRLVDLGVIDDDYSEEEYSSLSVKELIQDFLPQANQTN